MPTTAVPRSRRCRRTVPRVDRAAFDDGFDALARSAVDGDSAAWDELVARLQRVAWRAIAGFDLSEEDRKDAFAGTFFRLYERLGTIREPAKLPGWVATTARNEVHTLLRARRRDRAHRPPRRAPAAHRPRAGGSPPRGRAPRGAPRRPGPPLEPVPPAAAPAHHGPAAVVRRGRRAPRPAPREHRPHPPALPRPAPRRRTELRPFLEEAPDEPRRHTSTSPDDDQLLAQLAAALDDARPGARRRRRHGASPPSQLGPRRRGARRARVRLAARMPARCAMRSDTARGGPRPRVRRRWLPARRRAARRRPGGARPARPARPGPGVASRPRTAPPPPRRTTSDGSGSRTSTAPCDCGSPPPRGWSCSPRGSPGDDRR